MGDVHRILYVFSLGVGLNSISSAQLQLEPLNNGHTWDKNLVFFRKVVRISEVVYVYLFCCLPAYHVLL